MAATDTFKKGLALSALAGLSYALSLLRHESMAEGSPRTDTAILVVSTIAFPSFTIAAGLALNKARHYYAEFQTFESGVRAERGKLDTEVTELRRIKKIAKTSKNREKHWRRAHEKIDVVARQAAFTLVQDEAVDAAITEAAEAMIPRTDPPWTRVGGIREVRADLNGKESLT